MNRRCSTMATDYERAIRALETARDMSRTIEPKKNGLGYREWVISTDPPISYNWPDQNNEYVRFGTLDQKAKRDNLLIKRRRGDKNVEVVRSGKAKTGYYPVGLETIHSRNNTLNGMKPTMKRLFDAGIAALNALRDSSAMNPMFSDRAVVA